MVSDPEVISGLLDDRAAVADLTRAVRDGEVVPWYQPIVDLTSGGVVGVEALARWQRSTGPVLAPAEFIGLAERSDLIIDLDLAVLRHAFADLAGWQRSRPEFRLSVNLSGRHFDRADSGEILLRASVEAGIDPASVDLELTETTRPDGAGQGSDVVEALQALGFRVLLDDFGSGWSALRDLVRLRVDGIKIDRSFAELLGTHVNDAVVRALTTVAGQVGFTVTIEGIEALGQADRARALGCDLAQGYLWSRPVRGTAVSQWLAVAEPEPGGAAAPARNPWTT